jgi:hypothetical protein
MALDIGLIVPAGDPYPAHLGDAKVMARAVLAGSKSDLGDVAISRAWLWPGPAHLHDGPNPGLFLHGGAAHGDMMDLSVDAIDNQADTVVQFIDQLLVPIT